VAKKVKETSTEFLKSVIGVFKASAKDIVKNESKNNTIVIFKALKL